MAALGNGGCWDFNLGEKAGGWSLCVVVQGSGRGDGVVVMRSWYGGKSWLVE